MRLFASNEITIAKYLYILLRNLILNMRKRQLIFLEHIIWKEGLENLIPIGQIEARGTEENNT